MSGPDPDDPSLAPIVEAIAGPGWCVRPGFLAPTQVQAIVEEARGLREAGAFKAAGIGRGRELAQAPEIRGDRIAWVDRTQAGPATLAYLDLLEGLRARLNRELFLGLFELEAHLALYPPGAFYRRHLDQFRGLELRTLTCILYLNRDWGPADGGALRIYTDPSDPGLFQEVLPESGTFVAFLSARFEHEVMPALSERLSLTGWIKRRA